MCCKHAYVLLEFWHKIEAVIKVDSLELMSLTKVSSDDGRCALAPRHQQRNLTKAVTCDKRGHLPLTHDDDDGTT